MAFTFNNSSLLQSSITIIRNKDTPPIKFRNHLRKIGRYLIYEASKNFEMIDVEVTTPITNTTGRKIKNDVVIISILRAALPMVDSIFDEFDNASLGVISASRGPMIDEEGRKFSINMDYQKIPNLENKIAIIVDPMLATASTIEYILENIIKSKPKQIFLLSAIASQYGVDLIENKFPQVKVYCGVIDKELNNKGYIVPGLGDAGDRACNTSH